MAETNGHQDNPSRLDRIEAALELMIADHEQFRDEHKRLLSAQVVLQDAQRRNEETVQHLGRKLDALVDIVDRDHREFHARLTRLEEKN